MKPNPSFVLCATDFTPAANDAANVAARLARQRAEGLRLVHATDTTSTRALAETKKRLEAEAQRLRELGATVEPLLLEGMRPSDVLVERIRAERPTLVVVSSSVKGPLDRWAMGSFSERIAESSPVPTLVVRNPAVFENCDWSRDRLKVLLALDLHSTSDVVLRWAKAFRMSTPCDVVSCYVNRRMPTTDEAAVPPGRPVNPPELQSRLERQVQKKLRDQIGDDASTVVVKPYFGDPGPCIAEIAGQVKAHLIAVGTHQRRGLSRLTQFSVSRELLHQAGTNVVCIPV
ncbi:MAG: universal stress protein, partial [Opitutaceae bacterium]